MALFGTKKNTKKEAAPKAVEATTVSAGQRDLSHILTHARITEKASMHQGDKVYTFDISDRATKRDIIRAVYQIYKVTPKKIRTVTIRTKSVRHAKSGKLGVKGGGKKAYVYLKSGDSIIIS
ncbi:MAG: 50S ribosomal protein L23 [Candidatus Pacebacteria bacterium]|nr:50S ribosomal protein L23 [Candidatus Paceibacterota bacterium]